MKFEQFVSGMTNHLEGKMDDMRRRFRNELRHKSDDEVRSVIRNGNSLAREVAMEEADRRGISY